MGKTEGPVNGREAKGREREQIKGRRRECGLGLE